MPDRSMFANARRLLDATVNTNIFNIPFCYYSIIPTLHHIHVLYTMYYIYFIPTVYKQVSEYCMFLRAEQDMRR